jgi:SAM-dependent methyltransferase
MVFTAEGALPLSEISSAWYADFFTELPNEFWRRAVPLGATELEVEFIERQLELAPGSRIVDVPCGSGRHSLALAARGHRLTGLDISVEAIGFARNAAMAAGLDIDLRVADMRSVPRDGSYDAAMCLGNSFGYLDITGTREFLAALADAVRPGGGLVIDFNCAAESILPGYTGEARQMRTGDITVDGTTEYDIARSRLISGYRFSRGSQLVEVTAIHHLYTVAHLGQLLTDAGFTDIERFGGIAGEPFVIGSGRLLLTARLTTR